MFFCAFVQVMENAICCSFVQVKVPETLHGDVPHGGTASDPDACHLRPCLGLAG